MPSSRTIALALLLLVLPAPMAWAEGEAADAPAPAEEIVEFTMAGPTTMQDFLTLTRKALKLPLAWDARNRGIQNKEFSPNLSFRGSQADALHAVRGLLMAYELALVPIGQGQNRKYWVSDVRATHAVLRLRPKYIELNDDNLAHYEAQNGTYVTTLITVKNLENLRDARNALNRLVTWQNIGSVTEVPAANGFVVTDFAPKVVSVYRTLQEMDVPPAQGDERAADKEVVFQAIALEHAQAEEAARVLQQHFGIAPPPPEPRRPGSSPAQSARPVPGAPPLRIDADPRLNQLLVTGRRQDLRSVQEVVASMDRPVPRAEMQILVLPLVHVDAVRAAAVLTALIQRGPTTWLAEEGVTDLPVVVADGQTNTLLIHSGEAATQALRRLVRELDQPSPEK